jgi:predicted transcriptional regulator
MQKETKEMTEDNDKLLAQLIAIKKLLILIASKLEATQPQIGEALGINERTVRKILQRK